MSPTGPLRGIAIVSTTVRDRGSITATSSPLAVPTQTLPSPGAWAAVTGRPATDTWLTTWSVRALTTVTRERCWGYWVTYANSPRGVTTSAMPVVPAPTRTVPVTVPDAVS